MHFLPIWKSLAQCQICTFPNDKQIENLTFTGGQSFCSELQGLWHSVVTSSLSQSTDGEKAWVFRYFELPILCKLLEMLCESRIMSSIWLFSGIALCWDSGEKQNVLLKFSVLGRSSSREVLHKKKNKTKWIMKNKRTALWTQKMKC